MGLNIMSKFIESIIINCGSIKAVYYLKLVSFIESIFFPIPTDALLAPMVLSGKHDWINISLQASIWSVLGGVVGYYLGFFIFDTIEPIIHSFGKYEQYLLLRNHILNYMVYSFY